MDGVWDIYKDYVKKHLRRLKVYDPAQAQMQQAFIGTKNFKPEGEPKWEDLPDIGY